MFFLQLLILGIVIFAGMVVVLRWLMGQHAMTATAHLQGLSQDYLKRQDDLKKRQDESERQYQEQVAKAQEEAAQIKMQAVREAESARLQALDQAHQEAERIVQQAIQTKEALHKELTQSMDDRAIERACELIRQMLPDEFRQAMHATWIDGLVSDGLIAVERVQVREDVREARVVAAFPLTASQRRVIAEKLSAALGSAVTLHEAVDPRLVAGLTITLGHLVLDGSLASKLLEAVRHAQLARE